MKRLALGLVVVLAFSGLPVQADYLQWGVDAARTGQIVGAGPVRPDVAFQVEVPSDAGSLVAVHSHPLIIDGAVYLAVYSPPQIVRIDLGTAEVDAIASSGTENYLSMVSDGQYLYVVGRSLVEVYSLDGLEPAWDLRWEPRTVVGEHASSSCVPPAISAGVLYLLCVDSGRTPEQLFDLPLSSSDYESTAHLMAVDTQTRQVSWERAWDLESGDYEPQFGTFSPVYNLGGVSVVGPRVVTTTQQASLSGLGEARAHAFSLDGDPLWDCSVTPIPGAVSGGSVNTVRYMAPATGDLDNVYFAARDLFVTPAEPPGGGCDPQSYVLDQERVFEREYSTLALSGHDLYVGSMDRILRFDTVTTATVWEHVFPPSQHIMPRDPLLISEESIYSLITRTQPDPAMGVLWFEDLRGQIYLASLDPDNGHIQWQHELEMEASIEPGFKYAVADGVIAIASREGWVRVLGQTPASLAPRVEVSSEYPKVGETVTVDLSGSLPGVHGEATGFRANWGDGTLTPWRGGAAFNHSFERPGTHVAEFSIRNDAGQTATEVIVFRVGQEPPQQMSWLQSAMGDPGFLVGFVGVLLAAGGGLVGLYHHRTLRNRLHTEIEAADRIHATSRDKPAACLLALDERKARAQGMIVDGKLSEPQYQVLENHIDRLRRGLRVASVEAEWDFLPQGMARSLQTMMEDGSVTRFERDAFLEKLDKTKGLTKQQREKVRQQVESWFQEDAGGGPT